MDEERSNSRTRAVMAGVARESRDERFKAYLDTAKSAALKQHELDMLAAQVKAFVNISPRKADTEDYLNSDLCERVTRRREEAQRQKKAQERKVCMLALGGVMLSAALVAVLVMLGH
ncbi:MAG TPA: hypothetical protein VGP72_16105 [Planctomycetota bacterium]|jgi:uncharacterized protein (DUF885 family)